MGGFCEDDLDPREEGQSHVAMALVWHLRPQALCHRQLSRRRGSKGGGLDSRPRANDRWAQWRARRTTSGLERVGPVGLRSGSLDTFFLFFCHIGGHGARL